jgi:hypothetical protein
MHNCTTTTERLTELLLDGSELPVPLATELRECSACREEFRVLKETLRLTTRLIETATPPHHYWPGYHARLSEKLHAAQQPRLEPGHTHVARPSWLVRFFASSIRLPVPVGLALLAIFGFLVFKIRVPAEPAIVRVPVQVPVIQEKPVERVVYRDRIRVQRLKPAPVAAKNDPALASLDGFEPAEEVKMTVIKGASSYEK